MTAPRIVLLAAFFLDLGKKAIYFADGEATVFCRVRIYRGEPLD